MPHLFPVLGFFVKLLFIKLISFIPISLIQSICGKILRSKYKLFLFEFVLLNPTAGLVFGSLVGIAGNMQARDYLDKINFLGVIVIPFIFFSSIFLLWVSEIR